MRETCYRCFWPKHLCWCGTIRPMPTRTRIVLLMHPKEFKEEKANTGRLTHLCLANSEIIPGLDFADNNRVNELLRDPANFPVLLYPGENALKLGTGDLTPATLAGRQLVVFLLDATWACARKMLKLNPALQTLPRIMFTPAAPSRYIIKQQPHAGCLSTLEAVHELLQALEKNQLDTYPDPAQLLANFDRMQQFQIRCAADPTLPSYRTKKPYGTPETRKTPAGRSARRRRYF